ncbi:MAG: HepT-like ribonuclease domain-containing protein [Planctomycetota bacterium]
MADSRWSRTSAPRSAKTQRAVERSLEIVGGAARKVSAEFEEAHPEIPWQAIVAHRHVLAHEYGEVSQDLVWRVVEVHTPALIARHNLR